MKYKQLHKGDVLQKGDILDDPLYLILSCSNFYIIFNKPRNRIDVNNSRLYSHNSTIMWEHKFGARKT